MRSQRPLRVGFALVFCAFLLATSAAAQTWWVQSADYGAGNRRQDVTNLVRRLVSGPNFTVNNQTMGGDPFVGADKTLRIKGRDSSGAIRDFNYGEGATVNSAMFRGTQWNGGGNGDWNGGNNGGQWVVQTADYGAGNRRQDVTNTVNRLVNGPDFRVNNTTMGIDPWKGADKTLRIVARDSRGQQRDFSYKEGSTVNSAMFRGSGWNGGGGWNGKPGVPNNYALQINSARWGSGSRYQDVTARLQGMVRNNRLTMRVTPQNLGDPTPGVSKTLIVNYSYQGSQRSVNRVEGETLSLP
jgi:hypothetical protein